MEAVVCFLVIQRRTRPQRPQRQGTKEVDLGPHRFAPNLLAVSHLEDQGVAVLPLERTAQRVVGLEVAQLVAQLRQQGLDARAATVADPNDVVEVDRQGG
ncbi:MAG: hypothetical protein CO108_18450, partial [Deltaproteobacteria bacterium CG_4_9_14_3_um_filter_63_12]